MRSLIKLVIGLAILAGVAYGGVQGYLHYQIKKGLDEAIKQASPFVNVKYRKIYVSPRLDGTVGVDGIVIEPKQIDDAIRISSVRLSFADIFQLLSAMSGLDKHEFPEDMRLSVSGVNVALNGPLMTILGQAEKQGEAMQGNKQWVSLINFNALGCADMESIGVDDLLHMGYQELDVDLDLSYQYDKRHNLLKPALILRYKGMFGFDIKAVLNTPPSAGAKELGGLMSGKRQLPTLRELKITYLDGGFALLRNRYCAARLDSSEEFYIAHNLEAMSRAVGAIFPEDTMESYKKFLVGNSSFTISMEPKPGTDISTLGNYQLKDVIDLLDMKVTVDSHDVDFSKFEWGKSYSVPNTGGKEEQNSSVVELTSPKIQMPAQYHTVALSQLGRYVGSQVKLATTAGVLREGVIESVEANSVTIRLLSQSQKGFISFPIAFSEIASAKVLYAE